MITVQGFQQSRRSDAPLPAPRSLSLALCPFFFSLSFFLFNFFLKLSSSSFNPQSLGALGPEHPLGMDGMLQWDRLGWIQALR